MAEKKTEILIPQEVLISKVHEIRGQKVMLDRDLTELYQVETKQLKRQVRRNIDRFPDDFMFELSIEEHEILRSQSGTSNWGGTRYAPMAFTEQGVAMLSSALSSPLAIKVNMLIRNFPQRDKYHLLFSSMPENNLQCTIGDKIVYRQLSIANPFGESSGQAYFILQS